jgi:hypothetical protein
VREWLDGLLAIGNMSSEIGRSLRARARSIRAARSVVVEARHVGVRNTDSFVVSYPKSGSTWLRFMLAALIDGVEIDFESVEDVIPSVGRHRKGRTTSVGGRLIKSHEPYKRTYGRRYRRVVYVARDPRAVVVSYYWFQIRNGNFTGSLSDFVSLFVAGGVDGYGTWADHVDGWLDVARDSQLLLHFVRYEDMLRETPRVVRGVAQFLEIDDTVESVERVVAANSRARMAAKEAKSTVLATSPRADIPFVRPEAQRDRGSLDAVDVERIVRAFSTTMGRVGY